MLTAAMAKATLPKRPLDSNKGTFGKVMLLCGSPPYPGSAFLAGSAAGRVGAGLVTLAVTEPKQPISYRAPHQGTLFLPPPASSERLAHGHMLIELPLGYCS